MSLERKFSFLYSEIVEDENDMIGHIAYSLYKSNKIQFIQQFKEEHDGKTPTEEELQAFHKAAKTTIAALKIQAEQILSNFTQITFGETIEEIEKEIKTNQESILKEIIEPIIPPKAKGPWDGFLMAVLVKGTQTLVLAIIIFLIIFGASAKDDFWGTVRKFIPESKNSHIQNTATPSDSTNLHTRTN